MVKVLQSFIATEYFSSVDTIYEFGCGTGHNLIAFAKIFPSKRFIGSDFVQSSIDLVNYVSKKAHYNLTASLFDMKNPDFNQQLEKESGLLTFGALEQLAGEIDNIFSYFLKQDCKVFVHIEPAEEFYDLNNLADFLAFKFQTKRGYTKGLYAKLIGLQNDVQIRLVKVKRLFFGSLNIEGYNLFVWKKI